MKRQFSQQERPIPPSGRTPVRIILLRVLVLLGLGSVGGMLAGGCKMPQEVPYGQQQFASIRVLNFAISQDTMNCLPPFDIFMDPASSTRKDSLAKIHDLGFGQSSVYTSNLQVAAGGTPYDIAISPVGDPTKTYHKTTVTLSPGKQYTLVLYRNPTGPATDIKSLFIEDQSNTAATSFSAPTYVRFINLEPNTKLSVTVNDPSPEIGTSITPGGSDFLNVGQYIGLQTAPDTSYTFFVTDANDPEHTIVSRLAFQSFAAGSYHTIVYGGDKCLAMQHPLPGAAAPDSTMRIRVFDDNNLGNDQTFPVPQAFRYNVVNGIIPTDASSFSYLGLLVNNEGDPALNDLTFPPVPTFGAAGAYVGPESNGVRNVYYQSAFVASALDIKGYSVDQNGGNKSLLFDIVDSSNKIAEIHPDLPVTYVIYDTAIVGKVGTSTSTQHKIIALPDQSYPDSVTLVLINALSRARGVSTTQNYTTWKVNGNATGLQNATAGRSTTVTLPLTSPGTESVDITVGNGSSAITVDTRQFQAEPGGIYEVVLLGQRPNASNSNAKMQVLVLRVNGVAH